MPSLHIEFNKAFSLEFVLESNTIADLWHQKMLLRHQWPLDDPARFYGFNPLSDELDRACHDLMQCINTINNHAAIIDIPKNLLQQDTLNYLHSIFEKYHGLLDQQTHAWWHAAPKPVQQALSNLNIAVHRAENVIRNNQPRFVCTWFGMPKDSVLADQDMLTHGTLSTEFGGVYLNYVEIGKTLEDLAHDNDRWISHQAFQPFKHYSADFVVKFFHDSVDLEMVNGYFLQHKSFFNAQGIQSPQDIRCVPYRYKVAQLTTTMTPDQVITNLSKNQLITDIYIE